MVRNLVMISSFFFDIFYVCFFCPPVTALLEYLDPAILHLLGFALLLCSCKPVAVLTTKRHSYNDQPMYTQILKLFFYSVYPVAVTKVSSFFT